MKNLRFLLLAATLALPAFASGARADNVSASQISAAGHGRRPILTNRPSREIYQRGAMSQRYGMRHHRRHRY